MTSGNAYSKIVVALAFGFLAGRLVDRFGPRRLMLGGIVMAGGALVGLSYVTSLGGFYFFYLFNALGYVFGGPLPNQVLLSRWFDKGRGKAMGFAYLGIGVGGALVPLLAFALTQAYRLARRAADPRRADDRCRAAAGVLRARAGPCGAVAAVRRSRCSRCKHDPARGRAFYFLMLGSMASIGAVGGTMQNLALYLQPRSPAAAGRDRHDAVAHPRRQHHRAPADGVAGRSLAEEARDAPDLRDRGAVDPAAGLRADDHARSKVCAFLFGIGLGGDYMIIPLMAAELYGVAILGRVMGIVLTADSVAEALVPMLVASMRDSTGSYTSGFLVLVGLAALGALAVAFLPRSGAAPSPRS